MSATVYTIPKGTRAAKCPRGCGADIYWVEAKRAGHRVGTSRIPVDTSLGWCAEPDSLGEGKGCNHFTLCPNDS